MSYIVLSDTGGPHEIREYENDDDLKACLNSRCTMGDFKLVLDYRFAWVFPKKQLCILDEKKVWHLYFNQPAWYESTGQKLARVQIHGRTPGNIGLLDPDIDYSFPWEYTCLLSKSRTERIKREN